MRDERPMALHPLEHRSHNGSVFKVAKADLSVVIDVTNAPKDPSLLASDIAEFAGWHAMIIHPELRSGFQGYDCLRFKVTTR